MRDAFALGLALACATASAEGLEIGFRLMLGNPDDTNLAHRVEVTSSEAGSFSAATNAAGTIVRRWRGHRLLGDDFIAEATLKPAGPGAFEYGFSYRNCRSPLMVERIGFPDLAFDRTDGLRIFYPHQQGHIVWPQWESLKPGETAVAHYPQGFHFIAALEPSGECVYLDQREGARLEATEVAALQGDGGQTAHLVSWYDLPVTPETARACRLPFTGIVRRFRGDWFEACRIYRDWVRTQPFYQAAARRPRGQLADVAMWFWNRGPSEKVIAPVERFRDDSGVPVALDWYWWHKISYDTDFPHFWPPREPVADFRAGIARCRLGGIYVQPYVNGMTWDFDSPTWNEGGAQGTVVERDGSVRKFLFNRFTGHSLAYMCGEAPDYQAHMRKTIRTLAGCGFNGVYMDMINNAGWGPCWNRGHRHPRGGGSHMAENFRRYVSAVRTENPGLQLSSEDGCEAYLELFDSVISLYANGERLTGLTAPRDEFVPGFNAIFHECVTSFGSFAMIDGIPAWDETWPATERWTDERPWERLFPEQFAVELSRGPTWGIQPCVHNFLLEHATDPRFAEDYRFMVETARFWHRNRAWLLEGEMLAPGKLTCPTRRVEFMRRSTYAKKGEFATCVQEALPTVFHSVWRAPDGRIAAVLVNWSRTAQTYSLKTPDMKTAGELPARSWRIVHR